MGHFLVKSDNEYAYGYVEFVADTEADKDSINTISPKYAPGSKCYCIDSGITYILNTKRQWCVYKAAVVSNGGGASEDNSELEEKVLKLEEDVLFAPDAEYDFATPTNLKTKIEQMDNEVLRRPDIN